MKDLQEVIRAFKALNYGVVRTGNKAPVVNNWQFLASDTSLWAGNLLTANEAGFVISKDIVVIDVDPRNFNEGIDSLRELSKVIDFDLVKNAGFSVKTASGGYHLYYKKRQKVRLPNTTEQFKGVEFKQKGQQVVLPFSILPDNRKYGLINANLENLTELPQSFYNIIGTKANNQAIKNGVGFVNNDYDIERVRQILENTEPAIEGQGGDNHTYRVCCIGKENGLSSDVFFELLCEWNEKCSPPWSLPELRTKMDNAYNYSQNAAGSCSVENMFSNIDDKQKYQKIKVLNFKDFLDHKMPPKESILSPVLKQSDLAMIYAKRGIGKTFLAIEIAYAVANGGSLFGKWKASKPRKVLFIDGEMCFNEIQERFLSIAQREQVKVNPEFIKIITPDIQEMCVPDLSTINGQKTIDELLEGVEFVVLDNLSTLCRTGKENESESWIIVQQWILSLRRKNIAVLLIHHAGKSGEQRGNSKKEDILKLEIFFKKLDYQLNKLVNIFKN